MENTENIKNTENVSNVENVDNVENTDNAEALINYKEKFEIEHNNYIRALADMENIKKHFLKEINICKQYENESILKDILPVIDDIKRAAANNEISEGVQCIVSKFLNVLANYGLSESDVSKGNLFNSDIMEAVATVKTSEEDKNKVIDITQAGYIYKNKIIRYPKVIVGC